MLVFLLNEYGDPHFLFYKFNENNILNNWEKYWQKSMATFLANEVTATDRRDFKQRERGRRRGRWNRWEDWGENAVVTEIHKHKATPSETIVSALSSLLAL